MTKLFAKARNKLNWLLEDFTWFFLRAFIKIPHIGDKIKITIGITTFMDRFETCLKPLLSKTSILFPDCQIIVIANGHVKNDEQIKYLSEIEQYCKGYNNVTLIAFTEPRGLSYLWNTIIRQSKFSKLLILNDDIKIRLRFRNFILEEEIIDKQIATINYSWSHFFITKPIVEKIGWFDERLHEIGGEDDDYAARLALAGINVSNFNSGTITGKLKRNALKINSYGRDMSKQQGGYSTLNSKYLKSKWIMSNEYFQGATYVPNRIPTYWKIRNLSEENFVKD